MNGTADEARYPDDVGLKELKFGTIGLGTYAGLVLPVAILF